MRVYVESSVFGKHTNLADKQTAEELFKRFRTNHYRVILSELVESELNRSAKSVRALFNEMLNLKNTEYLSITSKALGLRQAYLDAGVVGKGSANDALHVALATIARCSLLTSFDRSHIVKSGKIWSFNQVNKKEGYAPINILFPSQFLSLSDTFLTTYADNKEDLSI